MCVSVCFISVGERRQPREAQFKLKSSILAEALCWCSCVFVHGHMLHRSCRLLHVAIWTIAGEVAAESSLWVIRDPCVFAFVCMRVDVCVRTCFWLHDMASNTSVSCNSKTRVEAQVFVGCFKFGLA